MDFAFILRHTLTHNALNCHRKMKRKRNLHIRNSPFFQFEMGYFETIKVIASQRLGKNKIYHDLRISGDFYDDVQ